MKILFYSPKCKHSKNFIEYFKDLPEYNHFKFVCVDKNKNGQRDPLIKRLNIKRVPSIYIDEDIYEGEYAFKWLSHLLENYSNMNSRQIGNNREYISEHTSVQPVESIQPLDTNGLNYQIIGDPNDTRIITPGAEDLVNPETGETVYTSNSSKKKRRNQNDSLKSQQLENTFNKMKREREEFNASIKKKKILM